MLLLERILLTKLKVRVFTSNELSLLSTTSLGTGSLCCGLDFGSGGCCAAKTYVSNRTKDIDENSFIFNIPVLEARLH